MLFALAEKERFERERPREGGARPPPVAEEGSVRSEQIRSIGSALLVRDRDDYICEVRRNAEHSKRISPSPPNKNRNSDTKGCVFCNYMV